MRPAPQVAFRILSIEAADTFWVTLTAPDGELRRGLSGKSQSPLREQVPAQSSMLYLVDAARCFRVTRAAPGPVSGAVNLIVPYVPWDPIDAVQECEPDVAWTGAPTTRTVNAATATRSSRGLMEPPPTTPVGPAGVL